MSRIVRTSDIRNRDGSKDLTVSTVKLGFRHYDTVIFDNTADKRHSGKRVGDWVIDSLSKRDDTRDEAMDTHREALYTARAETIS